MKHKKIHIWDLPRTKIYVFLDNEFRESIINGAISISHKLIEGKVRKTADKLGVWLNKRAENYNIKSNYRSRIIFHWRKGETFIPLWVLVEIIDLCNNRKFSLNMLEKNVILYKSNHSSPIFEKKFPLKLSPEFIALYFHIVGDGTFSEKKSTASYSQLNKHTRKIFVQKLKHVFGDYDFDELKGSKYVLPLPSLPIYIIKYVLNVNSFLSNKARIPKIILEERSKILKMAGIIAFLLDEGTIDDSISWASKNKEFLQDFQNLLGSLGYDTHLYLPKNEKGAFILYLKNKHLKDFYKTYLDLINIAPKCNLSFKEDKLKVLVNVNKRIQGRNYVKKEKNLYLQNILKSLRKKSMKTNELRICLFRKYNNSISYTALKNILKKLEKKGFVKEERILRHCLWRIGNKDYIKLGADNACCRPGIGFGRVL